MVPDSGAGESVLRRAEAGERSRVYEQGIVAGALGAATIAAWFFLLDLIDGQPFFTPSVLGTAIFRGLSAVEPAVEVPVDFEMVFVFTWVHLLVFLGVGVAASLLLDVAERQRNVGFGILLLFVVFQFGFVVLCAVFAEPVLETLAVWRVLLGNILAAGVMAVYFWRKHPGLVIEP
jgi:hypothetical protein